MYVIIFKNDIEMRLYASDYQKQERNTIFIDKVGDIVASINNNFIKHIISF